VTGSLQRFFSVSPIPNFGQSTFSRRIAGVRYRQIAPPLPVEDTVECHNRFRFGIPWPWQQVASPGGIVSATGDDVSVDILAQVDCPRTDGATVSFAVWAGDEPIDILQFSRSANQQYSQLYRGRTGGSLNILLDDARAIITVTDTSAERILRITSEWHDRALNGEFRSPLSQADSYRSHFETIVGTWSWL
jgi:hypothetical protein